METLCGIIIESECLFDIAVKSDMFTKPHT